MAAKKNRKTRQSQSQVIQETSQSVGRDRSQVIEGSQSLLSQSSTEETPSENIPEILPKDSQTRSAKWRRTAKTKQETALPHTLTERLENNEDEIAKLAESPLIEESLNQEFLSNKGLFDSPILDADIFNEPMTQELTTDSQNPPVVSSATQEAAAPPTSQVSPSHTIVCL